MIKFCCALMLYLGIAAPFTAQAELLTLDTCLQLARKQNSALQVERRTAQLALEQIQEADSRKYSRVNLDLGYTVQQAPQEVQLAGRSEPTQEQSYAHLNLSAEQLLYDFGRTKSRSLAARAQASAAKSRLGSREQDLFLQTAGAFYRVLAAEQLLRSARKEVDQVAFHRKLAAALFDEGVVTRNDLLQAAVRLAASQQEQYARAGDLGNAWLELNSLLGRPASLRDELQSPSIPPQPLPAARDDLERRPDLAAQQEQVVAARSRLKGAQQIYRPEFYARLGADYLENDYVKEQVIYSASLGFRMQLFDGYASQSRERQALVFLDREKQRLRALREQAELELQRAQNDTRVAWERITVAETAITQALENLRINQNRYREQVGTASEVLDAQTLLTQARTRRALAEFDYHLARARVRHAEGRL